MKIGKQHSQIEDACQEYNKVAMSAHLIPSTAENAFGVDYRLWPDTSERTKHEKAKFAANIKPALNQILVKSRNSVRQATEMKLNAEETVVQLTEQVTERQEALSQEQAELKRLDDTHAAKKEHLQNEVKRLDAELEKLRGEISVLQTGAMTGMGEQQHNQLKIMRNRYASLKQARDRDLKEMVNLIRFALSEIVDHKLKMKQSAQNAVDYLQKQAENISKEEN
eukprot:GHVO01046733.1.p1 GENE.GHVO01046733.1~~GHVO01046733.1.p1  ORF type:complete len:224 (+),score=33.58 GHVO01046733.1:3-674(+)